MQFYIEYQKSPHSKVTLEQRFKGDDGVSHDVWERAFTLTEIGSHWKVFDVKDCCDLTYILKDHSGCSADNWLLKYYCSNS